MNTLNIVDLFKKEHNSLLNIFKDTEIYYCLEESYIAGGSIWSAYNNKQVNDFDFFLTSSKNAKIVKEFFNKLPNLNILKNIKKGEFKGHKIVITENAISIGSKYQIITKWYGKPEDVIAEFDFVNNMSYFYKNKIHGDLSSLKSNKLKFNKERARDISGVIMRIPKLINKGFTITKSEIAEILLNLKETEFNEREMHILNSYTDY